jgi:hypothetical protein
VPAGPDPEPITIPFWFFELDWAIHTAILVCLGFLEKNPKENFLKELVPAR